MPIYTYQIIHEDGTEGDTFQVVRRMSDPPLTRHPETGERVVRVYEAPNIAGKWSESATKAQMSDKNLERLGFTKYQRLGKGQYERTAGSLGPPKLDARD
ncbi:MAG: FmdB family transcriptional regulator [Candidatus Hydrogenedentes bacterium]|nr:FmdB family transcriptional regulator [Candidatus Hydrogenedentota bacterium]